MKIVEREIETINEFNMDNNIKLIELYLIF